MTEQGKINRRILVVDDNESIHDDFRQILCGAPHDDRTMLDSAKLALLGTAPRKSALPEFEITSAFQGRDGLEQAVEARRRELPFAVAFVDVRMPPGWDGIETTTRLLEADKEIQVVICTAFSDYTLEDILERFGANDRVLLLRKPFEVVETCLMAVSLTEKWRLTHQVNLRLAQQAEQIVDAQQVMAIIEGCLEELETAHDELRSHSRQLTERLQQRTVEVLGTRDLTMFALAQLADSRDPETGEHLLRMRAYAQLLADHLSETGPYTDIVDAKFVADFYGSTPLHDIGKVGIPDQVLLKPGPLTAEEFEIMKQHTIIGSDALNKAAEQNKYGTFLSMAAEIARWHHEKFDGTGYPDGLRGQAIPLSARITALADVFDALTSQRVYKDAMDPLQAKQIIDAEAGRHFDPAVVAAFHRCFESFVRVKESINDSPAAVAAPPQQFDAPFDLLPDLATAVPV